MKELGWSFFEGESRKKEPQDLDRRTTAHDLIATKMIG
jgi:hypothetical protein